MISLRIILSIDFNSELVKVACRVQILKKKKKHFVKIVTTFVTVLLKMTLGLCIHVEFEKKTQHYFKSI